LAKKEKRPRNIKHRQNYGEEDVLEAVWLVREQEFSVKKAVAYISDAKQNPVPRMTLMNQLVKTIPTAKPYMEMPMQISKDVEEALVNCLELCASYNYPNLNDHTSKAYYPTKFSWILMKVSVCMRYSIFKTGKCNFKANKI
jgi:hypothetical protein